jgi:glycine hydroxymethyltransferase
VPGGIRVGTSALTSRNMLESDITVVGEFLHRAVQLALLLQKEAGTKMLKDFVRVATVQEEGKTGYEQVKQLRKEVKEFAMKWPLPGVEVSQMTKPAGIHED